MLSERDRKVLEDMERELRDDDPEFARRFPDTPVPQGRRRWRYTAGLVAALVVAVVGIVLGLAAVTLLASMVACGVLALRWWLFSRPAPDDGGG